MNDLDERIRTTVATMLRDAPEPVTYEDLGDPRDTRTPSPRPRTRRNLAAAAVAAAVVIGIVAVVVALRPESAARRPAPVNGSRPTHEVVEYSQTAEATCPGGTEPIVTGRYDRMRFESWADPAGDRYRMRVTYPDGSTRDVVAIGDPWYPTELFERGSTAGRAMRCLGLGWLGAEPGQGAFWSLNPMAAIPSRPDGEPAVLRYSDMGTQVPGGHRDSRGRTTELWRQSTGGTVTAEGMPTYSLRQTQSWYVDPATGRVLERTWDDETEGVSRFTYREVLVTSDRDPVEASVFATDGYRRVPQVGTPGFNAPTSTTSPSTTTSLGPPG